MKHSGKASDAALKLIGWTFVIVLIIIAVGLLAAFLGSLIKGAATVLVVLWVLFAVFTFYFFRDPEPQVPNDPAAIISPAHGKVDLIDETTEKEIMGGACRRVSIFLSVVDVHVQNAPIAGQILLIKHTAGQFLNALNTESAIHNENVLIGFASSEKPGEKIAVRLIAGLIARRIVPWVKFEENVARGERISLIQFGSRVDIYMPLSATVKVKLGDRVVGGESIIAVRD